jgi:hypothetical protein
MAMMCSTSLPAPSSFAAANHLSWTEWTMMKRPAMRSPSIVPQGFDVDVYVVLDDFGKLGRSYREVDEEAADRETVIRNLMSGQYNDPVRIVAFNTTEGWARDVTEEIASVIRDRANRSGEELSAGLRDFIDREIGRAKRLASLYAPS